MEDKMRPEQEILRYVREGTFEIDRAGRIWRLKTRSGSNQAGYRQTHTPRKRAENKHSAGYFEIRMRIERRGVRAYAHRLVWENLYGPIPDELEINHKNGIKTDNRPENLEAVTRAENTRHAYKIGLRKAPTGIRCNRSKLTEKEVIAIRTRYAAGGVTQQQLGDEYGITNASISFIIKGRSYPHVSGPTDDRDHRKC